MAYNSRGGKVIVTNTRANLARVDRALSELHIVPTQVCLDVQLVRLPWTEVASLATGSRMPQLNGEHVALLLRGTTLSGNTMAIEQTAGVAPLYRATVQVTPTMPANGTHVALEMSVAIQRVKTPDMPPPPEPTDIETKLIVEDGVPYVLSCSGPHASAAAEGAQRYVECLTVTATLVTP